VYLKRVKFMKNGYQLFAKPLPEKIYEGAVASE